MKVLDREAERVHAGETAADEHRVELLRQRVEHDLLAQRLSVADLDAADRQQPGDLPLREAVDGLVGRESVFVQAAGLRSRLEDHHVVPEQRGAMRARQTGGPGADHRDALAGPRLPPKDRRARRPEIRVGRMTLQQADLDRLVLVRVAHARVFAQHFGRTDARAHAAEHVRFEDGLRRAAQVVVGDAADERRHVDAGRAGGDAGRVVAVVAAIRLDQGLRLRQRRMRVVEVVRVIVGREAAGSNVGPCHAARAIDCGT